MSHRLPLLLATFLVLAGCHCTRSTCTTSAAHQDPFHLRPDVELRYGYTQAIRVGDTIHIAGAVSMDDAGNPTAVGNLDHQMRNCYRDLEAVLAHYGCTFDDVVVENIYTTDMPGFLRIASYRSEIYGDRFPAGTWLEVKGLALPEFMIEIDLEAHAPRR